MTPIFDGKTLQNWDGDPKLWSVKDGVLRGETTPDVPAKGNTFIIWKGGTLKDFELRLSFRVSDTNNSGIQYRSKESDDFVVSGYQADIEDGTTHIGILYEERGRGILAKRGEKVVVGPIDVGVFILPELAEVRIEATDAGFITNCGTWRRIGA